MDYVLIGLLIAIGMYLAPIIITLVVAIFVGIGSLVIDIFKGGKRR